MYSAQINIQKNVFNGGIIGVLKTQSDIRIKRNENTSELAKHTINKEVTEQYLNTYQSQELYRLTKEIADTIKKQLELTGNLLIRGIVRHSDYLFLKIELANQTIPAAKYLNEFRKNLSDLNTLCGLKDSDNVNLSHTYLDYSNESHPSNFIKQFNSFVILLYRFFVLFQLAVNSTFSHEKF